MGRMDTAAIPHRKLRNAEVFMNRDELQERIRKAEAELKTAGPIHARDLRKFIRRMKKELIIYGRYREAAAGRES